MSIKVQWDVVLRTVSSAPRSCALHPKHHKHLQIKYKKKKVNPNRQSPHIKRIKYKVGGGGGRGWREGGWEGGVEEGGVGWEGRLNLV